MSDPFSDIYRDFVGCFLVAATLVVGIVALELKAVSSIHRVEQKIDAVLEARR